MIPPAGAEPIHSHQLVIPNKFAEDTNALSSLSILTDLYGNCGVVPGKWSDLPPGRWIQKLTNLSFLKGPQRTI